MKSSNVLNVANLIELTVSKLTSNTSMRENTTSHVLYAIKVSDGLVISKSTSETSMRKNATSNVLYAIKLSDRLAISRPTSPYYTKEDAIKNVIYALKFSDGLAISKSISLVPIRLSTKTNHLCVTKLFVWQPISRIIFPPPILTRDH